MRIGIIGAGNMGSAFAKRLSRSGHSVQITARRLDHAEKVAREVGGSVRGVQPSAIAKDTDVIILAVPYASAADALSSVGDLQGKTVIEISNPLTPDMSGLVVGHTTSAAEEIQKKVPRANVVKAFNTIFASVLAGAARAQVFYAGNDENAKRETRTLIEGAGFEPLDAGPLANARYLEPLGMLTIYEGYVAGMGTSVAPALVKMG